MRRQSTTAPSGVEIDGVRLRELRKLAGDDLKSLAGRAGITFQYVSQLERGVRRRVSPPVFARICDALGVTDRRYLMMTSAGTGGPDPRPACPCPAGQDEPDRPAPAPAAEASPIRSTTDSRR